MERIIKQFKQQQHLDDSEGRPIVTGSSVLALVYKDGVMMATDTLCSYGSMARYRSVQRIQKANEFTILATSGEYSDFHDKEECSTEDGEKLKPKELFSFLNNLMYQKRNKFDPLYNSVVLAGFKDSKPFLGCTDLIGTNYTANIIATGFGNYFAMPLLRSVYEKKKPEEVSEREAKFLLGKCMEVLFYRDARTINKIQYAKVDKNGIFITPAEQVVTKWDFKGF